jgi:serine/threonine protein kinase/class 3 adenylate cyclase
MTAQARPPHRPATTQGERATLLCIDLVESTALIQALGDGRAGVVLARFAQAARDVFRAHDGREIDHTDGFLVLCADAPGALAMALDLHQRIALLAQENRTRLGARIGIHCGEAIIRPNAPDAILHGAKPLEVEGLGKAICARVCSLAGPGQTLLTDAAFEEAQYASGEVFADPAELRWLSHGLYTLKGVDDALLIHEVGRAGEAPLAPPLDVEKARHLRDDNLLTGWRAGAGQEVPGRPDWILQRKIGEGGFGDAWLARAGDGTERVFKFCFQLGRLRSLQREVTLFRLLQGVLGQRDDIARIIDWQLDVAPYYIETEYCACGDLAAWATANGGLAQIAIETRLALIAEVADALAAAHAVGVLHKDVKPGNVLIANDATGRPHARLADFGIATINASSRYRHGRGIVLTGMTAALAAGDGTHSSGTRMYMAPEQVEGREATTYADIFAVGVLLYQVVCADFSKSLATGWEDDIEDPLLHEDIAGLITRDPAARIGGLELFAARLRALPQRRRERAAADARRVREMRRRRRRRLLVPVFALLSILVIGLAWGIRRVSLEAQRANREAAAARAVTGFLVNVFKNADPEQTRGENLTVREAMDHSLPELQTRLAQQPEVQTPLLSSIGQVYLSLGLFDRARPLLQKALDAGVAVLPRDAPEREELRLALQDTEDALGDYPRALELGREALAEAQALHGDNSLQAARARIALGNSYNGDREDAEAARNLEDAVATLSEIAPDGDDHGEALWKLAVSYIHLGREGDAMKVLEQSLAMLRKRPEGNQTSLAAVLETMAGVLRNQGRFREALTRLRAAEKIYLQLGLAEHTSYASDLFSIANAQSLLGEFEGARRDFATSLAIYRKTFGERPHPSYALNLKALGGTLCNLGRYAEAEPLLRESAQLYEKLPGLGAINVPRMQSMIGLAEVGSGKIELGLGDASAALASLATAAAKDSGNEETAGHYVEAALTAADAMQLANKPELASRTCSTALEASATLLQRELIYNRVRQAKLLLCANRTSDAAPILQRLDESGYRDRFLDRMRKQAGIEATSEPPASTDLSMR